jgi:hypothetical protein
MLCYAAYSGGRNTDQRGGGSGPFMSAVLTAMLGASGGAVLAEAPSPSPAEAAKVTQSADAALREECMYAFATKTFKLQQIC